MLLHLLYSLDDNILPIFSFLIDFLSQNFVGLSVADGFITCGSQTNEVLCLCPISVYHFENLKRDSIVDLDKKFTKSNEEHECGGFSIVVSR